MNNEKMEEFFERVRAERRRHVALGWTAEHDRYHDSRWWAAMLAKQVGDLARWCIFDDGNDEEVETALVQITAVAVAFFEARR